MKNTKFNKRFFIRRIIALPFIFIIIFISHNTFVLRRTYFYLMFGGEYINFEENERESISEIFEMLKEIKNKQKVSEKETEVI